MSFSLSIDDDIITMISPCTLNLVKLENYQPFKNIQITNIANIFGEESPFVICSKCKCAFNKNDYGCNLRCGHNLHAICAIPWFYKYNYCPVCHYVITDPTNYQRDRLNNSHVNFATLALTDGMAGMI